MKYLLYTHLCVALITFVLGLIVYIRRLEFRFDNKMVVTYMGFHLVTAISGLLIGEMDIIKFSPFQWLSILTIFSYIGSSKRMYDGNFKMASYPMLGAYLGLCIAFAGALHPSRLAGFRLWNSLLNLNDTNANQYWSILMLAVTIPCGTALIYYNIRVFRMLKAVKN
jgi:uncharacterized membrane protein